MAIKSATTNVNPNNFNKETGRSINFPKQFLGLDDKHSIRSLNQKYDFLFTFEDFTVFCDIFHLQL